MRTQDLKQLSEHMDRQIAKQFDEYRKFDDYVKREVRHKTAQMYKTISILGAALSLVVGVGGYFGIPFFVKQKTKEFLNEATSREGLAILSNQTVSVVQAKVPAMIDENVRIASEQLEGEFAKRVGNEIKNAEASIRVGQEKSMASIRESNAAVAAMLEKFAVLDIVIPAKAGNRKSFDQLRCIAASTNANASLAKDAVTEIEGRYLQRRHAFGSYHPMLQRADFRLERDVLVDIVHGDFDWNCDGAINELVATRDKGFVETLVHAVRTSKRLDSVYTAINGLKTLTGQSFKPLGIDEVLGWWKTAGTNAVYHSGYEAFQELLSDIRGRANGKTTVGDVLQQIERVRKIAKDHPSVLVAWKFAVLLVTELPESIRLADGRGALCEEAVRQVDALSRDKVDAYVIKAYYLAHGKGALDETRSYVNGVLPKHHEFEARAKKSKLFADSFFEDAGIDWPSRRKHPSSVATDAKPVTPGVEHRTKPQVEAKDVASDGIVGYVNVTIRKGRRPLLELPFNKSNLLVREKLGGLSGSVEGDEISWTLNGESSRYTRRNEHWLDGLGEVADEVEMPVGDAVIYYERTADVETQMSFSGKISGL